MSVTLHIPYHTSNIPVVQFTDSLDTGIVHIEDNNVIESGPLPMTHQYFMYNNTHSDYTNILCRTSDDKLGLFPLPDNTKRTSWVLTYSTFDDILSYKWTDIEEIGLTKYLTMNINGTSHIDINDSLLKYNATNYTYNAILDLVITYSNIINISDIVKDGKNIYIVFSEGSLSTTDDITDFQSFYKYTVNVTNTTTKEFHVSKFIPDIKINSTDNTANYHISFVTVQTATIYDDKDITKIKESIETLDIDSTQLQMYGTLTITEQFKTL